MVLRRIARLAASLGSFEEFFYEPAEPVHVIEYTLSNWMCYITLMGLLPVSVQEKETHATEQHMYHFYYILPTS